MVFFRQPRDPPDSAGGNMLTEIWLILTGVAAFAALLLFSKRARTITKQCVAHPRQACEIDPRTSEVTAKKH